jgi:crotonobetainyl-CoA:carnitine CoA-transferase CaiB-like acyl-CoA transferase
LMGFPSKMTRTPCEAINWPPELGEHTRPVLEQLLGMSSEEVSRLEASGAIYCGAAKGSPKA